MVTHVEQIIPDSAVHGSAEAGDASFSCDLLTQQLEVPNRLQLLQRCGSAAKDVVAFPKMGEKALTCAPDPDAYLFHFRNLSNTITRHKADSSRLRSPRRL